MRAALEGALAHLKQQCPAVVSSRRERSLERALPLVGNALVGEDLLEWEGGQGVGRVVNVGARSLEP